MPEFRGTNQGTDYTGCREGAMAGCDPIHHHHHNWGGGGGGAGGVLLSLSFAVKFWHDIVIYKTNLVT